MKFIYENLLFILCRKIVGKTIKKNFTRTLGKNSFIHDMFLRAKKDKTFSHKMSFIFQETEKRKSKKLFTKLALKNLKINTTIDFSILRF